jgi:hypothetical protein
VKRKRDTSPDGTIDKGRELHGSAKWVALILLALAAAYLGLLFL